MRKLILILASIFKRRQKTPAGPPTQFTAKEVADGMAALSKLASQPETTQGLVHAGLATSDDENKLIITRGFT